MRSTLSFTAIFGGGLAAACLVACGDHGSGQVDGNVDLDTAQAAGDDVCGPEPFPTACSHADSTAPPAGWYGSMGDLTWTVGEVENPRDTAPGPVSVYLPDVDGPVPVLFFAHAYRAAELVLYARLFERLASNGLAVVHVPFATDPPGDRDNAARYADLWAGFLAAVEHHRARFDLDRVGFFGHSFGGGATPELARRGFVDEGWGGVGRFMFIMAPWYSWGTDYDTIPSDVRTVIQVYVDDDTNDHRIAVSDIWERLPSDMERGWLMLVSDECQHRGLNAGHVVAMTSAEANAEDGSSWNGLDTWGVARRIHALADHAFSGDGAGAGDSGARAVAFGTDASMGNWVDCDPPVEPLEAARSPITASCRDVTFPLEDRCDYSDDPEHCE